MNFFVISSQVVIEFGANKLSQSLLHQGKIETTLALLNLQKHVVACMNKRLPQNSGSSYEDSHLSICWTDVQIVAFWNMKNFNSNIICKDLRLRNTEIEILKLK